MIQVTGKPGDPEGPGETRKKWPEVVQVVQVAQVEDSGRNRSCGNLEDLDLGALDRS